MSCHKGRFDTCDTGGSCRSSWSLCTTSVKSSAWKQTTSLVIRGWSLLGKKKKKREFQEFLKYFTPDHYSSAQQKASLNQWPTSVLHCEQNLNTSQQRIILKKEGWFIDFPFFFFLHFCCIHNKSDICMDNILKSLRTGSNCYYQSSLCSRNHNLPQFFHSIIEQNNSALREKCKITK